MNILYMGKYKKRFHAVILQIKNLPHGSTILELCFGDIYIAEFCNEAGYRWKGLDINNYFVQLAQRMGFDAQNKDVAKLEVLPKANVCVMMGSLYHFHPHSETVLAKMLQASENIVISEPVLNLSSKKGLIGFLAKRAANIGKGHEAFRYNKESFTAMIEGNRKQLGYEVETIRENGKDMIVKLRRNENR
ncbi:MAG: hypothetical protein WD824_04200 [Cyclobacteriaceae bacterium]